MHKLILIFGLLLFSYFAIAQDQNQDQVDPYLSNINIAKEMAVEKEVPIMLVFAGSDWCRPCIQFKKEVLESDSFQAFSEDNLLILYLDFPARKKNRLPEEQTLHNEELAAEYNQTGLFPKIVLLNSETEILGTINYIKQKPEVFIKDCKSLINL